MVKSHHWKPLLLWAGLALASQARADQGPFQDEIWGAVSPDGRRFHVLVGPFFRHASVPDVLELSRDGKAGKAGTLLLYFVDFSRKPGPGQEGLSVASSQDGKSWSRARSVSIAGKPNRGAAVDPSVVELPDGRLRLYFFGSETTRGDPGQAGGAHRIYSAVSDDGVHFQAEPGTRFEAEGITDPEVLRVGAQWWMLVSRGMETLLARSSDGLAFVQDATFTLDQGGVPGAVELPGGAVRIFVSGRGGILSSMLHPGSPSPPEREPGARITPGRRGLVADPACLRRLDGSYYLVFKRRP